MKVELNKVTWYSKLASVVILVLLVPMLTFYIGQIYTKAYTKVVTPVDELGTRLDYWSTIEMSEKDMNNLFDAADTYIRDNSRQSIPYEIVLDKKLDQWAHLSVTPADQGIAPSQIYMRRGEEGWKVEAFGSDFGEFCAKHPGLCL